jgi:hypothetical protein
MMSLLKKAVSKGKQIGAQIHVVAGDNGVGKTTFACSFPSPLCIDLENGSRHLDVERIKADEVPDITTFRAILKELIETDHSYKTIVIDSVESLESLISDAVCAEGKVKSIELFDGGYGKGYVRSREMMREVMEDLRALQKKEVSAVLVAHTQVKSKTDPATNQTYDRVIMRCNDKMAALIRDLADNCFYCTHRVLTTKENNKTKAFGDGQRVMFTQWRPGFDAKNRLDLPLEIPLSYEAFVEACSSQPPGDVISEIEEIASKLDEQMKIKVRDQVEKYKNNPAKLKEIKNRLLNYAAA